MFECKMTSLSDLPEMENRAKCHAELEKGFTDEWKLDTPLKENKSIFLLRKDRYWKRYSRFSDFTFIERIYKNKIWNICVKHELFLKVVAPTYER